MIEAIGYLWSSVSELCCVFSCSVAVPSWSGTIEVGRTVEHRTSAADEVLHVS